VAEDVEVTLEQDRPAGVARDLDAAIARVHTRTGAVVGGGFHVDSTHLVTCAHVVTGALGGTGEEAPGNSETVAIDFPLIAPGAVVQARVEAWQPVQADDRGDIAVLAVTSDLPPGVTPVRLVSAEDYWGHPFRTFGFPRRHDHGVWAAGVLRGTQGAGWVQMEGVPFGYPVEPGFSGAAVWDDDLAGVVGMTVAADARTDLRAAYLIPAATLVEAWPSLSRRTLPPCPYRGLYPFRAQDAAQFFGREELVERLAAEVARRQLVAVVGPSGSGKSSVVFAGLVPKMLQRPGWITASMRPAQASSPVAALAGALLPLLEPDQSETQRLAGLEGLTRLLLDGHLADVVDRVLTRMHATRLLLVIDQFEELYGREKVAQATEFTRALLSALTPPESGEPFLTVVLTLRADFLGSALQDPTMAVALEGSVFTIGQMGRDQLRSVIRGPLPPEVRYEAGLVERILGDVGEDPGSLPLLEFALTLLWERQERGLLTHEAYEQLGGVDGALAAYAERVYSEQLLPGDQDEARRLFVQLVRPSDLAGPVRRVARRGELGEVRWQLGQRIAATRLLVADRDATGAESVELVHEALIDGWSRLHEWVTKDAAFRAWQERLRASVQAWEKARRDPEALLRGVQLAEADRWLQERRDDLGDDERKFITLSKAFRGRSVRRLRAAVAALTVLLLVAAGLGIVVTRQAGEAREQARSTGSRSLATQASALAATRPDDAMTLAAAAYVLAPTEEATRILTRMASQYRHTDRILATSGPNVAGIQFSPVDPNVLALHGGKSVALWDIRREEVIREHDFSEEVFVTSFSPTGDVFAVGFFRDAGASLALWFLADDRVVEVPQEVATDYISEVRFSPSARQLAVCTTSRIEVWTVEDLRLRTSIPVTAEFGCSFSFSSTDDVVYMDAGELKKWDVETNAVVASTRISDSLLGPTALFSPDGRLAIVIDDQGTASWWDLDQWVPLDGVGRQPMFVQTASFTPDGRWAVLDDGNGGAYAVDMNSRTLVGVHSLPPNPETGGIGPFSLSPNGRWLAFPVGGRAVGLSRFRVDADPPVTASQIGVSEDDGSRVVALSPTGEVTVHRLGDSATADTVLAAPGGDPRTAPTSALSSDGRFVARWDAASSHLTLARVSGADVEPRTLERAAGPLAALGFAPGGRFLVAAYPGEVIVWSTDSGEPTARFPLADSYAAAGVAVDPEGRYVATHDSTGRAQLWDAETDDLLRDLTTEGTSAMIFSARGRWLSAVTRADTRLWDVHDLEMPPVRLPMGGPSAVIEFSGDETQVAVAATPQYPVTDVTVWRIEDRQLVGTISVSSGFAGFDFAFAPDGQELIVATQGLHVEKFQPTAALDTVCELTAKRNLTREEWDQYAPGFDYISSC
jgi:WD40 repeat protein